MAEEQTMTEKTDGKLLATGIVGALITALCCFTPVLAVLLGAIGLSSVLGWMDFVLFPALAFFTALTAYAVWQRRARRI